MCNLKEPLWSQGGGQTALRERATHLVRLPRPRTLLRQIASYTSAPLCQGSATESHDTGWHWREKGSSVDNLCVRNTVSELEQARALFPHRRITSRYQAAYKLSEEPR